MYALESAMDELAYATGVDPVQLRLNSTYARRTSRRTFPSTSKTRANATRRGCGILRLGAASRRCARRAAASLLIGQGMASATYPATAPSGRRGCVFCPMAAPSQSGTQDIGTGTYTTMRMVAAEALGFPYEKVQAQLGDSAFPRAPGLGRLADFGRAVLPAVWAREGGARQSCSASPAAPRTRRCKAPRQTTSSSPTACCR